MTAKEELIDALEGQGILVKVSTKKEAYEVFTNVSEFLNFRLVDKPESSDSIHSHVIHAYLVFSTEKDDSNSELQLDYAIMYGTIPDLRILKVYQNADELYGLVSPNSNSDNLTGTISKADTVLTVTDLKNFSQKYGIDICTNNDGWLVIDGTNEAILSTDELTHYIGTIESMSDITKKFVRK